MPCPQIPALKLLKIQINRDISALNVRPELIQNGFLSLFIDPSKYQPSAAGGSSDYRPTGKGSYLTIGRVRRSFTVGLDYQETSVKDAVHLIAQSALQTKQDLQIIDYVAPEPGEVFTTRESIITSINYQGNIFLPSKNNTYTPDGFSITYVEKVLRYL